VHHSLVPAAPPPERRLACELPITKPRSARYEHDAVRAQVTVHARHRRLDCGCVGEIRMRSQIAVQALCRSIYLLGFGDTMCVQVASHARNRWINRHDLDDVGMCLDVAVHASRCRVCPDERTDARMCLEIALHTLRRCITCWLSHNWPNEL